MSDEPKRYRRGDLHPSGDGRKFWQYLRGGEYWVSAKKFDYRVLQIRGINLAFSRRNRERLRADQRRRYAQSPCARRVSSDKWRAANKEKANRIVAEWRRKNPDRVREYARNFYHTRKQRDPIFALSMRVRGRLTVALRTLGRGKVASTVKYLGCSFADFKTHIEKQFIGSMSWENFSDWVVDHKIPMSSAETSEDVFRLSHYTNLQPLWFSENSRKSDMPYEDWLALRAAEEAEGCGACHI